MTNAEREDVARSLLPMVKRLAARARRRCSMIDVDEAISDGALALTRAIDRYDPTRGECLRTYAYVAVRNAIMETMRRSARRPQTTSIDALEAIDQVPEMGSREADPAAVEDAEPEWLRRLTPDELATAELLAEGATHADLAWLEDVTDNVMRRRIGELREKVRVWGGAPPRVP